MAGITDHPLYATWQLMRQRCENPNATSYCDYGARGIRVCEAWRDSWTFIRDIEKSIGPKRPGRTLDRINPDGHYEPGNVRWATSTQQVASRRNSIIVELDGEVLALRTACMGRLGLTRGAYNAIYQMIREGHDWRRTLSYWQVNPSRIRLLSVPGKRTYIR